MAFPRSRLALPAGILGALFGLGSVAHPSDLPPHGPLRLLIVSDEVNPHGLSPAELTQPGDLSAALTQPGAGLSIDPAPDGLVEIATDDLPQATALLNVPPGDPAAYDVLIYFAHRGPNGAGAAQAQADFEAAVEDFLEAGGGLVSFHHGSYETAGKAGMMALIGATATGAVPWNTVDGQDVINVSPGHFVTTQGVEYTGSTAYSDPARGVAAGTYELFNNTPDERYPQFAIHPQAEELEVLFASDYADNGGMHLLGFTHRRASWSGIVVGYQPGEYQPLALDDPDGNNFQILCNAILFAAGEAPGPAVPALGAWHLGLLVLGLGAFVVWRRPRSPHLAD